MLNKHVRGMFLLSPSISVGISTDIAPCWRWSLSVKRLKIWMRSHFTRGGRKKEVGAPFCHKGLGAHCRYPQSLHVMWGSGPFVATTNFRTVSALSLSRIHVPSACTKAKALGSVPEHTATWCQVYNYKVLKFMGRHAAHLGEGGRDRVIRKVLQRATEPWVLIFFWGKMYYLSRDCFLAVYQSMFQELSETYGISSFIS